MATKIWKIRIALIALGLLSLQHNISQAQSLATFQELKQKHPDQGALFTKLTEELVIEEKNGKLNARSYIVEELLILKQDLASAYNTNNIVHSYFNKLIEYEAYTMAPNGKSYNKVKPIKSTTTASISQSVFYDDAKETTLYYGGLTEGAYTVLKYTIEHTDVHMLPSYYFKRGIPVQYSEFKITYPKDVALASKLMLPDAAIKKTIDSTRKTITITYSATELSKVKFFSKSPRPSYYLPHVLTYLERFEQEGQVKGLKDVAMLNRYLTGFISKTDMQLDAASRAHVDELVKNKTTEDQKAATIFNWVQDQVRYIAFEDSLGGFIPRAPKLVYHRKFGDCKDMASLLTQMLRHAGIEAYPTWIGTRNIPYTLSEYPTPGAFNHMICLAKINKQWVVLDATASDVPYGATPYSLQGKEALIHMGKDKYEVYRVPLSLTTLTSYTDTTTVIVQNNVVKGSTVVSLSGHMAWDMKTSLKYKNEKDTKQAMQALFYKGNNKFNLSSTVAIDKNLPNNSVRFAAHFDLPDYIKKSGEAYYLNLNLTSYELLDFISDIDERNVPFEFDYPASVNEVFRLELPAGYDVKSLPKTVEKLVPGIGYFKAAYQKEKDKIVLQRVFSLETLMVKPNDFDKLMQLVTEIQTANRTSLALIKK